MSGPHFRDYHLLLDEQGDQIFAMTDPLAERVRKIGGITIHSIGEIARLQRVEDNDAAYVTPQDMLSELRDDNKDLVSRLMEAHGAVRRAQGRGDCQPHRELDRRDRAPRMVPVRGHARSEHFALGVYRRPDITRRRPPWPPRCSLRAFRAVAKECCMSLTHTDAAASKNALPKRRLGRTDMHITPVGLGAWAIGGGDWAVGWGSQDDKQSIAAIRHAAERGINWIDTAAIYGLGHSEEIVRQALKDMPSGATAVRIHQVRPALG